MRDLLARSLARRARKGRRPLCGTAPGPPAGAWLELQPFARVRRETRVVEKAPAEAGTESFNAGKFVEGQWVLSGDRG